MPAKRSGSYSSRRQSKSPTLYRLVLALTLVPVIFGGLLILLWFIMVYPFGSSENQLIIGALLILLGFAASNALQKRWYLASGWFLLAVADFVILTWMDLRVQVIAFVIGGVGVVFLGMEFYSRYQQRVAAKK